jgi:Flp pilus assembly protein TadD
MSKKGLPPTGIGSPLVHIILILIIGVLAYSNTFSVPFQWDDKYFICENPIVKDMSYFSHPEQARGLGMLYSHFKGRYIGYLTFALNYRVNGLEVTDYHIVNFAIHMLNSLLVYLLVLSTFSTPLLMNSALTRRSGFIAFFSALLFVSHPLQTEAVTYIYQRLASLAALFYFLSVTSYVRSRLSGSKREMWIFFVVSLVSAILGMKTKENTFTIPVTIALYEYFFFSGPAKPRIFRLLPFVPLMAIIPLTHLGTEKPLREIMAGVSDAAQYAVGITRWEYLITQFGVIMKYIRLLFFPVGQNLDHDVQLLHSLFDLRAIASLMLILSIFGVAVFLYYRSKTNKPELRIVSFGILWFFVALSVESSIIPIQMLIDEYRVYLPSAGFFMAISAAVFLIIEKIRDKKNYRFAVSLLMLIPLVLTFASHARNSIWGSSLSLWEDIVKKSPGNIRAHNNLGNEYMLKGMATSGIEHFEVAEKLDPDNPEIHNNLGNAYMSTGAVDKALEHYMRSLKLKPDNAQLHSNLGNVYMSKGLTEEAIRHYNAALKLKPDFVEPHNNLGNAYAAKGSTDEAIKHYAIAINLQPDYADPHFNLGLVYLGEGRKDKAMKEFEIALRIRPDFQKARNYLEGARE